MSPEEAEQRLESELAARANQPIQLTWEDQTFELDPEEAGLGLDAEATVDRAGGGRSWNPADMVDVLFGADDVEPVIDFDPEALNAELEGVAEQIDQEPTEPMVTFNRRGRYDVTRPGAGCVTSYLPRRAAPSTRTRRPSPSSRRISVRTSRSSWRWRRSRRPSTPGG